MEVDWRRLQKGETQMDLPGAIEVMRPSTVQVALMLSQRLPNGKMRLVLGTGFLVHDGGYVLTARHVTERATKLLKTFQGDLSVGLAIPNLTTPQMKMRGNFEVSRCKIVEEDPRHDLSLLKLENNPFDSGRPSGVFRTPDGGTGVNAQYGVATIIDRPPVDGERVAVSGYPLEETVLITTSGALATASGVDVKETSPPGAPVGFTVPDTADSYLADVAVNPGNSGGPVYLVESAEVIGVCVAFKIAQGQIEGEPSPFSYNSGLTVVVPIAYGLQLLERNVTK